MANPRISGDPGGPGASRRPRRLHQHQVHDPNVRVLRPEEAVNFPKLFFMGK